MRLISQARSSRRLTPPQATARPSAAQADEEGAARRRELLRRGRRRAGHVDPPVERRELVDHRGEQVGAGRLVGARGAEGHGEGHRAAWCQGRPRGGPAARPLSSPPAMPRDWSDVFLLADGDAAAATADAGPEERRGFFRRLRENLSKTRVALQAEVQATLFETLDDETWERLEEALIMADVGATTTAKVVAQLEQEAESGEVEGGEALTARLVELLADLARPGEGAHRPAPRADRHHGRRGQRHGQDDDDRQARLAPAPGARPRGRPRGRRHLPRRRRRAARGVVTARGRRLRPRRAGLGPGVRRLRGRAPGPRAGRRRRHRRHGRAPAHAGRAHGGARQGPARHRQAARGRPARDAADRRRDDGAERPASGAALQRDGPRGRHRPDEARRHGQGRDRPGHRRRARAAR